MYSTIPLEHLTSKIIFAPEHLGCQDGQKLVAEQKLAVLVHRAHAVAVAVEPHPQVGPPLPDESAELTHVLGHRRVGQMRGEAPVGFKVYVGDVKRREAGEKPLKQHACGSVARVYDERSSLLELKRGVHVFEVGRNRVELVHPAVSLGEALLLDAPFELLYSLSVQAALLLAQLETVLIGGVVTAGDHHAGVHVEAMQGEVKHGCRHDAQIHHVRARRPDALGEVLKQPGGAQPNVAPHRDALHPALDGPRGQRAAYRPHRLRREIAVGHPPDVVGPEDRRVDSVFHVSSPVCTPAGRTCGGASFVSGDLWGR